MIKNSVTFENLEKKYRQNKLQGLSLRKGIKCLEELLSLKVRRSSFKNGKPPIALALLLKPSRQ